MMSDDFFSSLIRAFDYLPENYKLDITISFNDLDGYSDEQLLELFEKNLAMEIKSRMRVGRRNEMSAFVLCLVGIAFILISVLVERNWNSEGIGKLIVTYILDIVATVPFWGAMDIYIIEKSERRKKQAEIIRRFRNIEFIKKRKIILKTNLTKTLSISHSLSSRTIEIGHS
ncbi:MAG: hypothetical protein K6A70_03840 [Erysipelotrichaceae bacterium]|nr:hypothetical protein [Erysipelotrichaceae bacterium]